MFIDSADLADERSGGVRCEVVQQHVTPTECAIVQNSPAINILLLLRNSQVQAFRENNKRSIEQVRKGGLPPPVPNLHTRETAGVNHPS